MVDIDCRVVKCCDGGFGICFIPYPGSKVRSIFELRSALKLEYQHAKGELDRSGMDEPSLSVEVTRFSASAIEQLSPPKTSESEIWMNRQDLGPLLYNRARQAQGPNRRQKVKRKEIDGKAHFLLQDIAKHWRNDLSSYLEQCLSGRHPLGHGRN